MAVNSEVSSAQTVLLIGKDQTMAKCQQCGKGPKGKGRQWLISLAALVLLGRGDKIRTCDPLNPIQVLYQTEPHPDLFYYNFNLLFVNRLFFIGYNILFQLLLFRCLFGVFLTYICVFIQKEILIIGFTYIGFFLIK